MAHEVLKLFESICGYDSIEVKKLAEADVQL